MPRKTAPLLPATSELLRRFGERLRVARLRRRLSAKQVAERAGMNPMTLRSLERGGSGVTIGAYLAVMQVLGLEAELNQLAQADPVGRSLQDAKLSETVAQDAIAGLIRAKRFADEERQTRQPSSDVRSFVERLEALPSRSSAMTSRRRMKRAPATSARTNWMSSRELAALLDDPSAPSSRPSKAKPKRKTQTKPRTKTQTKSGTPSSRARRR
jgi:transcriptional regulator with XRE-family HTH domain